MPSKRLNTQTRFEKIIDVCDYLFPGSIVRIIDHLFSIHAQRVPHFFVAAGLLDKVR